MNAIVVVDEKWGIGRKNGLLFRLPADLKRFKEKTLGKVVVMGANTYFSLPKRPLDGRINVVLDADGRSHEGAISVRTVEELSAVLRAYDGDDVFLCGGASVYDLLIDHCDKAYVTKVAADGGAEVFFPNLDKRDGWHCVQTGETVKDNGYDVAFCLYEKK